MRRIMVLAAAVVLLAAVSGAQDWSDAQQRIIETVEHLSAATAPGGGGPDVYAAVLAPGYSRWTLGEDTVTGREELVEAIRGWWNEGWRVIDRDTDYLEVAVHGGFATTRRIVRENYRGPDGEESASRTALSETWIRRDGNWLLLRVDAHPLDP